MILVVDKNEFLMCVLICVDFYFYGIYNEGGLVYVNVVDNFGIFVSSFVSGSINLYI